MAVSIITANNGKMPGHLWLLSWRINNDDCELVTYRAYQTKKDGYEAFMAIVERLEAKYPDEMWFADVENAVGKTRFRTEAYSTDKIFASFEEVPFEMALSRTTGISEIK